jgi:hypothetical protein
VVVTFSVLDAPILRVPVVNDKLLQVVVMLTVTVMPVLITASSVVAGATPPLHVAVADQLPEAVAVLVAACELMLSSPKVTSVKQKINSLVLEFFVFGNLMGVEFSIS